MIEKNIPTTLAEATRFFLQKSAALSPEEQEGIAIALFAAAEFHGLQRRKSGEPYMIHPIQVATLILLVGGDLPTIQAALLHDTVEDTEATAEDIRSRFGEEVGVLVEAVTKQKMFSKKEFFEKIYHKAKIDPRVAWIKLADQCANHMNGSQGIFSLEKHLEHLEEMDQFYQAQLATIPDLPKELLKAFHRISEDSHTLYKQRTS